LGEISNIQFQKALDVFSLGKFINAQPITQGLFGQNVFITSTKGEFVLRGHPHNDWQFNNEQLFVNLLHKNTKVPVPHPYLVSMDTLIFGWEFVIMPKMVGQNIDTISNEKDKIEIATAQAEILIESHSLKYDYCGKYDLTTNKILPYKNEWFTEFYNQIIEYLNKAKSYNSNTSIDDIKWARELLDDSKKYFEPFTPTFFMQDFKNGNMVVDKVNNKWRVTGLFDLMESTIGHPEADLARTFLHYKRINPKIGYIFLNSYLDNKINLSNFIERLKIFILHDRTIVWEYEQRNSKFKETFKEWMEQWLNIDENEIHN